MVPHAFPGLPRRLVRSAPAAAFGLALAVIAVAGTSACDKMPLTAPAGTVITLVSAADVLPINGSTDVVAILVENGTTGTGTGGAATQSGGTPVQNGTLVTFTTSLGRIEPAEARTHNGRVTVKLTADGRSGTATVNAFSGGAKAEKITVLIGAAAVERVSLSATPAMVPANGGTVELAARVEDKAGNSIIGIPVSFTTTAGSLTATSALTGDNGVAKVFLSTTAEATVKASAGDKTSNEASVKVRLRATLTLAASSSAPFVGAPVTFTVTPGSIALSGVVINFGDGRSQALGTISGPTTVVHYYEDDGAFLVTVRGSDVDGSVVDASGGIAVAPITFSTTTSHNNAVLGTVFVFNVTGISTTVPIDHYEWNLGDGTVRDTNTGGTTHEYLSRGTKTITVTVVPLYGDRKTATFQVSVT